MGSTISNLECKAGESSFHKLSSLFKHLRTGMAPGDVFMTTFDVGKGEDKILRGYRGKAAINGDYLGQFWYQWSHSVSVGGVIFAPETDWRSSAPTTTGGVFTDHNIVPWAEILGFSRSGQ